MSTVDIHFSDVRPDFAMDAGTSHTVYLSMSVLPCRDAKKCAPDKNAKIVRSPSWSTCLTVCTDICERVESAVLGLYRLRRFAPCERTYHFLVSRPAPRGCGGSAQPRSC